MSKASASISKATTNKPPTASNKRSRKTRSSPEGYYNLAASLHKTGTLYNRPNDLQQAENLYNQCLERDPNHAECYRGLAVLLNETGRKQEAFNLLNHWAGNSPKSADPKIELARLLEEAGQPEQAKAQLVDALTIDPHNARASRPSAASATNRATTCKRCANYQRSLAVNRFQPEVAARVAQLARRAGHCRSLPPPPAPSTDTAHRQRLAAARAVLVNKLAIVGNLAPRMSARTCLLAATPDITSMIARQNSGRSSGLRLLTKWRSTTTGASCQIAPAFTRSSLMPGEPVTRTPR